MRNLFFSAIALITFGLAATEADAQFYVIKDGKVVYTLADLPESVTFEKPSFTVTFVSGEGATAVETQDVQYNAKATEPVDPEREGYIFKGWYNGEEPFDFSEPINGDITLTARWKKVVIPDAVDLGLPSGTKWATFNVGATKPEEYGDYFAWGEVEPHYADGHSQDSPCEDWRDGYNDYYWSTYKWVIDGGSTLEDIDKYTIADGLKSGTNWYNDGTFVGDNKKELDDDDDVAVQLLGGDWQMPTYEQQEELIENCYWVWTDNYKGESVNGYIVYKVKDNAHKGKRVNTDAYGYNAEEDTHIFLPAAGCRRDAILDVAGSYGLYWSRSLYADSYGARFLFFYSGNLITDGGYRYFGQSVRAVQRKN